MVNNAKLVQKMRTAADMQRLHSEFANFRESSREVQAALAPYLDAKDPLIALTVTLLANKQKEKDCEQSHS